MSPTKTIENFKIFVVMSYTQKLTSKFSRGIFTNGFEENALENIAISCLCIKLKI